MFKKIMVPVDIEHADLLEKSLAVAADLSKHYGASVCYVAVTGSQPSAAAHNPDEFEKKLAAFSTDQSSKHGLEATHRMFIGHDLTIDVDDILLKAIDETDADLVVMASHLPSLADYVWPSNGGKIAAHSRTAVFIVR